MMMSNTMQGAAERRQSGDRRHYSLQTLRGNLEPRRRLRGRRTTDRHFALLDHFDSGVVTMAILLMLLSVTDSMFTLTLLAHGGREVNPFMNHMLHYGVWVFALVKMLLTAIPTVLMVATGNLLLYRYCRVRSLLASLVGLYAGLILYELMLLSAI